MLVGLHNAKQEAVMMLLSGYVAYDSQWKIAVTTTNGRVRTGNSRKYMVWTLEKHINPFGNLTMTRRIFQFGFKAIDSIEAYEKLQSDKRLNALYKSLWERHWSQMMACG